MARLDLERIPESLIHRRWRKGANKFRYSESLNQEIMDGDNEHATALRLNYLTQQWSKLSCRASPYYEAFVICRDMFDEASKKVEIVIDSAMSRLAATMNASQVASNFHDISDLPSSLADDPRRHSLDKMSEMKILDPNVSKTKGRKKGKEIMDVAMQAQTKAPARRSTKDKFLVQSIIAPTSLGVEHISEMIKCAFGDAAVRKRTGNVIEEYKLTVVLVSANPPSPIPEASEESSSSDRSELEYAVHQNHWMILLNDSDGCPHFFSLGWFLNKCGKTFFYRYLNQSTKTSYMYLTSVSIRRYVPVTHLHPDDF
ncbi:hypothetical protein Dimus_029994 [Dionaea muscipula]